MLLYRIRHGFGCADPFLALGRDVMAAAVRIVAHRFHVEALDRISQHDMVARASSCSSTPAATMFAPSVQTATVAVDGVYCKPFTVNPYRELKARSCRYGRRA